MSSASLPGRLAAAYAEIPEVEAVAVAGSRTTAASDAASDVDLYVYSREPVPLSRRREVVERSAGGRAEIGNRFFEPGDEWIDAETGVHVDAMFRQTAWIEDQLARVLDRHEASVGYSTCFWHNVLTSQALFDRHGWFAALQEKARRPYPEELARAIVAKNHPLLRGNLSSYLHQIARAVERGDAVAVHHRVTALLASWFDILFAINRLPHPGEKRLLRFAEERCALRPAGMREDVDALLGAVYPPDARVVERAERVIDGLDQLLDHQPHVPIGIATP
ncbi:MAG TPA: DUF4037 domain-containing protein [Thermoanaerobaculia bacterium]